MSYGLLRPVTLALTVGDRTWDDIPYGTFDDSTAPPGAIFVAGGKLDGTLHSWAQALLDEGSATVALIGYPTQVWEVTPRIAEGDVRAAAWKNIKQVRPSFTATRDVAAVPIFVLDLAPVRA